MKKTFTSSWQDKMAFSMDIGGHHVRTDATPEFGGQGSAPSPKPLMVAALAGCSGIDVVTILKKMKVAIDRFDIEIEVTATDDMPSVYTAMHLIYRFAGTDLDMKKLERAVALSQDKYCGVSAMYKKAMTLTYEIKIEENR